LRPKTPSHRNAGLLAIMIALVLSGRVLLKQPNDKLTSRLTRARR